MQHHSKTTSAVSIDYWRRVVRHIDRGDWTRGLYWHENANLKKIMDVSVISLAFFEITTRDELVVELRVINSKMDLRVHGLGG